jgi:uncharacterized Zn-binding protein involved in type VI secretion
MTKNTSQPLSNLSLPSLSVAGVDVRTFGKEEQTLIPLYCDESGQFYVLLTTEGGPYVAPYIVGSEISNATEISSGGFLSKSLFQQLESPTVQKPKQKTDIQSYIRNLSATSHPLVSQIQSNKKSDFLDKLLDKLKNSVKSNLKRQAQRLARKFISKFLKEHSPDYTGMIPPNIEIDAGILDKLGKQIEKEINKLFSIKNISKQLAKSAVDELEKLVFDKLWKIDDSSSMSEQLAHKFVQEAFDQIKSLLTEAIKQEVLGLLGFDNESFDFDKTLDDFWEDWKTKFVGESSNATTNVGRLLDDNTSGGDVIEGAATVFINDFPVARLADKETLIHPSDMGIINQGNPTVLIETRPTAGKGHTGIGLSTGVITALKNCSPNVFMGQKVVTLDVFDEDESANENKSNTKSDKEKSENSKDEKKLTEEEQENY